MIDYSLAMAIICLENGFRLKIDDGVINRYAKNIRGFHIPIMLRGRLITTYFLPGNYCYSVFRDPFGALR